MIRYQMNDRLETFPRFVRGINIQGVPLEAYAKSFQQIHLDHIFVEQLKAELYRLPDPDRTQIANWGAPLLRGGRVAQFSGDESITPGERQLLINFRDQCPDPEIGQEVYNKSMAWWTDLPVQDLQGVIYFGD